MHWSARLANCAESRKSHLINCTIRRSFENRRCASGADPRSKKGGEAPLSRGVLVPRTKAISVAGDDEVIEHAHVDQAERLFEALCRELVSSAGFLATPDGWLWARIIAAAFLARATFTTSLG